MTARAAAQESARPATIRLRVAEFERFCAAKGAFTAGDIAALMGIDEATLSRYRNQKIGKPDMEIAMRFAERLNVTVEQVWERVAA